MTREMDMQRRTMARRAKVFQGFPILHEPDEGFYWENGGYCATVAECESEIADWNAEEAARDAELYGPHEDTPSLPEIPAA